jgi:hypothetical protein
VWEDEGGVEAVDFVEVAGGEGDFGGHFWRAWFGDFVFFLVEKGYLEANNLFVFWVLKTL